MDGGPEGKRILFSVLNWGFGHTVHAFPIIEHLAVKNEVVLAADGKALTLLRRRFPALLAVPFRDLSVRYARSPRFTAFRTGFAALRMLFGYSRERRLTKNLVKHLRIDIVISDNRYGVCVSNRPSFLMTHQLRFRMPLRRLEGLSEFYNRMIMRRFTAVWVLDSPDNNRNLSGSLTHNIRIARHPKIRYIGIWSDLKIKEIPSRRDIDYLAILSGPEPQRTIFENLIADIFCTLKGKKVLVRGVESKPLKRDAGDTVVIDMADRNQIGDLLSRTKLTICRSGYTSAMDLAALRASALMVPTPGQSEQEYQADLYESRGWIRKVNQKSFKSAFEFPLKGNFRFPDFSDWLNRKDILNAAVSERPKRKRR